MFLLPSLPFRPGVLKLVFRYAKIVGGRILERRQLYFCKSFLPIEIPTSECFRIPIETFPKCIFAFETVLTRVFGHSKGFEKFQDIFNILA